MAVTKYESYYKQIKESVDEIKENYDYKNSSNAFIHWYLKNHLFLFLLPLLLNQIYQNFLLLYL